MSITRLVNNISNSFEPIQPSNRPELSPSSYLPPENLEKIKKYTYDRNSYTVYQFPSELPKFYFAVRIGDYFRVAADKLGKIITHSTILLPMPHQMIDGNGVQWTQEQIGMLIGQAGSLATGLKNGQSALSSSWDAAKKVATNPGTAAGLGGLGIARGLMGDTRRGRDFDQVAGLFGIAPNQFLTVLMKGPAYKKYTFQWKLAPNNLTESKYLYAILQYIKNEMAPKKTFGNFFFQYPSIFQCAFMNDGTEMSKKMYKFKYAALEDFSVNYSGSGMPAFYQEGYPESVEMKMSFLEMEFWLNGDPDFELDQRRLEQ